MWPNLKNMMRWARIRGLREGKMQKARVEVFDNLARDDAQRPQDYGFAAMPGDGEALVLEIGGHTVIMRMDRMAERPQLAAYEVCVWHKEGHGVTLKSGGQIIADCTKLVVNASASVDFNTPTFNVNGNQVVSGNQAVDGVATLTNAHVVEALQIAGQDYHDHRHDEVQRGTDVSGDVV